MPVRVAPSRAGRLWLVRRLEIARRGVDVLDQKRQTLLREQQRLAESLVRSSQAWELRALEAADRNDQALALAGERRLRLAARHAAGRCEVSVEWRNALGTLLPVDASVRLGASPDFVALGGGSVVGLAARAHEQAAVAAADYAAARAAHDAIAAELAATTRRQRAIERRWIPDHEEALRKVALALEEREREDVARVRWALLASGGSRIR